MPSVFNTRAPEAHLVGLTGVVFTVLKIALGVLFSKSPNHKTTTIPKRAMNKNKSLLIRVLSSCMDYLRFIIKKLKYPLIGNR
jgi:hypothetical protein